MNDRHKRRILPTKTTVYREYAPGIITAFKRYVNSSACSLELCDDAAVLIDGECAHFPLKSIEGSVNDMCEIIDEIEHELELRCRIRLDNTPSSNGICLMISVPLFGNRGNNAWALPDEERAKSGKASKLSRTQVLIIFLAVLLGMVLHARFFTQY